jgi:glycoprotein-N-acetylgalactosamine 3-beta-galactosyltransferase
MNLIKIFLFGYCIIICFFYLNKFTKIGYIVKNMLKPRPRIFCIILTTPKNLEKKAQIVHQTWASKCDNHKFILNIPHKYLQEKLPRKFPFRKNESYEIELKNRLSLLQPANIAEENYSKLTTKVFASFRYVYLEHKAYYDWYLKADDDSFIHVDNLREFLISKDPNMPVTFGYDFKVIVEKGYHSGGGYLLSRNAFLRLGIELSKDEPICNNTGIEDVDVAKCLRQLNVYPNKSLDEMNRERFNMFSIDDYFGVSLPSWIYKWSSNGVKMVKIKVLLSLY